MISVIILNYNDGENSIKVAKNALQDVNIDKAIIVDNCSPDGSYEQLKRYENDNLIVLKSDKNGGFAYGHNFGINYVFHNFDPEIIITINSDVVIENSVIDAHIDFLREHKEYGLVSCAIRERNGEMSKRPCWSYPNLIDMIMYCGCITRKLYTPRNPIINDCEFMNVDAVRGSFMCFNAKALKLANGFDENTFLYNEENIISRRLKAVGYQVAFLPRHEYLHNHKITDKKQVVDLKPGFDSGYYYATTYGGVCGIKKYILRICISIGLFENHIMKLLKENSK